MYAIPAKMLLFRVVLLSAALSAHAHEGAGGGRRSYEGYQTFRVSADSDQHLKALDEAINSNLSGVMDIHRSKREALFLAAPHEAGPLRALLRRHRARFVVRHRDIAQALATEKRKNLESGFSWDSYYDIDRINLYLEERSRAFPNSTQLVSGGLSYEGRNITGLRIFTPTGVDSKPVIVIESGIHAREWITPAAATFLIEELLTNERPEMQDMRDRYDWHIFPSINPDGYHYSHTTDRMWRKSRSAAANGCYGADLNRNWKHNWGNQATSTDPCHPSRYAGTYPFSEVETSSLSRYLSELEDLRVYVALHSSAQMLLVPYSDSIEHVDNYDDLIQMGKVSLQYGKKVNGVKYRGPATAAEILYEVSGGSMDWVREALGTRLVFTYEMRGIDFVWPPERIPEQGRELVRMLCGLLSEATNMGYF